jgi:hypothetical protein
MECPYCASDIAAHALACPHCTRDLYLFKPLLAKIVELEVALAESMRAQVETLENRIAGLESQMQPSALAPLASNVSSAPAASGYGFRSSLRPALLIVCLVGLLIGAHLLLLFVYDLRPIYLRAVSIVLPLVFGLAWQRSRPQALASNALVGFMAAGMAVLGMLYATARIDGVPVFPHETREIREVFEYVASIGLAFSTGLLLYRLAGSQHQAAPGRLARALAASLSGEKESSLEKMAARIQRLSSAVGPAVTAGVSIYTGVKALMGD